eukprot:SAG31_NODE_33850_length_339_cov_0.866667_1_plen_59_part_01
MDLAGILSLQDLVIGSLLGYIVAVFTLQLAHPRHPTQSDDAVVLTCRMGQSEDAVADEH